MGHDHAPAATVGGRYRRQLVLTLAVTCAVMVLEVVGAWLSGSLSLLADAGHMLSDAVGVTVALVATFVAARPATARRSFGWGRSEVLAALFNALMLVAVAAGVVTGAVGRLLHPSPVEQGPMLLFAGIGLAANVVSLVVLRHGAHESLNVRGAYLEVLGDAAGSLAVIAAGVVIAVTGWARADAVASLAIAALILPRAWSLLRAVLNVLMEAAPGDVDLAALRRHILEVDGVVDLHDLHVWTITSGAPVMSAHVVVARGAEGADGPDPHIVLDRLHDCLAGHFDVAHSTFQLEPVGHAGHESSGAHCAG